jgi:hypothetical protein
MKKYNVILLSLGLLSFIAICPGEKHTVKSEQICAKFSNLATGKKKNPSIRIPLYMLNFQI